MTTTTVKRGKDQITLLNGQANYAVWKQKVTLVLKRDALWDVVEQQVPELGDIDAKYITANDSAMARIVLAIEDDVLIHIDGLTHAHDVWTALQKVYERTSVGNQLFLRRKMYTTRFVTGTMTDHIKTILHYVSQLKIAKAIVTDHEVIAALLGGLPESYASLVMMMEGRDASTLTIEYVTGRMMDEFHRRSEEGLATEASDLALRAAQPRGRGRLRGRRGGGRQGGIHTDIGSRAPSDTRTCYNCHKRGHFQHDCPQLVGVEKSRKAATPGTGGSAPAGGGGRYTAFIAQENTGMVLANTTTVAPQTWMMDSGASSHMTSDITFFKDLRPYDTHISVANGDLLRASGIGRGEIQVPLPDGNHTLTVSDVLYVKGLDGNLLSLGRMTVHGCEIHFRGEKCVVKHGGRVVANAFRKGNVFELEQYHNRRGTEMANQVRTTKVVGSATCLHQWHRRFGHRHQGAVQKLVTDKLAYGVEIIGCAQKPVICACCVRGKLTQRPFPESLTRAKGMLDLVHSDVCGPMPTSTTKGNRYILTLVDDYSRFTVIRLLKEKSEVTDAIKEYVTEMENQFGRRMKVLRTDNGTEYVNKALRKYCTEKGIRRQLTVPDTPQQNGVAERKNRSLTEMGMCMLIDAGLKKRFWGEAVNTATYLQNRLPSRSIPKTPYELWHGSKPDVSHLRVFGSKVFSFVAKNKRRKWEDKTREGVLVGYDDQVKAYRIACPREGDVWVATSVRIDEDESASLHRDIISKPGTTIELEGSNGHVSNGPTATATPKKNQPAPSLSPGLTSPFSPGKVTTTPEDIQILVPNLQASQPPEEIPVENIPVRRSKRTIKVPDRYCPNNCKKVIVQHVHEPLDWDDMQALSPRERKLWQEAANAEMDSLRQHKVWELADLPQGKRAIGSKWIFKAKLDSAGNVHTYKARLVAKGFSQRPGQDFDETYAPVVKHETVRVLLAVAAARKYHVRHLDVKTAYLHGKLTEELYLEQPEGYVQSGSEAKVLRLRRSIYGLKQAARAWNKMATDTLRRIGFRQSKADLCLFSRREEDGTITYILLYVDDMLVVGATKHATSKVHQQLGRSFEMKDLGDVRHYLGIELEREGDGSFLIQQSSKIAKMLDDFGMTESKPAPTPMRTDFLAAPDESPKLPDNKRYRQAIGSLLYLATVSRPDISVSVGILCRRVERPSEADWKATKRIMQYLASTIDWKLRLPADSNGKLSCFVDADWAGDREDRKSTSGYIFKLGKSTIAWYSRKQTTVALSSTEAEYVAVSNACRELQWLRQLLHDMKLPVTSATPVYEDNQGCIKMVESDRTTARTKHIDVSHHYLRNLFETGIIQLIYCPTENMIADILTKPMTKDSHRYFMELIGLEA